MLIRKKIEYLGIESPDTKAQIDVEIFGLKHAIKIAEEMISRLEQVMAIVELQKESVNAGLQKESRGEDKETEKKEGDGEDNQ